MFQSVNDPSLFAQLQARFPTSNLITELIQIHEGSFVVRALIQVGSTPIVTAMAAAASIEQAEDQARLRALSVVGITATSGTSLPGVTPMLHPAMSNTPSIYRPSLAADPLLQAPVAQSTPSSPTTSLPTASLPTASFPTASQPTVPSTQPVPSIPVSSTPTPIVASTATPVSAASLPYHNLEPEAPEEFFFAPDEAMDDASDFVPDDYAMATEEEPSSPVEPALKSGKAVKPGKPIKTEKSVKSKSGSPVEETGTSETAPETIANSQPAIAPSPDNFDEPDDLSSLIAFTDVEMDRVGWTKQEGRDYLKRTYRKSTRQKLDVDELMDFLNYLRALPSLHGL